MMQFLEDIRIVVREIKEAVTDINTLVVDLKAGIDIPVTVNGEAVTLTTTEPTV